jgi:hypothetical protein
MATIAGLAGLAPAVLPDTKLSDTGVTGLVTPNALRLLLRTARAGRISQI